MLGRLHGTTACTWQTGMLGRLHVTTACTEQTVWHYIMQLEHAGQTAWHHSMHWADCMALHYAAGACWADCMVLYSMQLEHAGRLHGTTACTGRTAWHHSMHWADCMALQHAAGVSTPRQNIRSLTQCNFENVLTQRERKRVFDAES